MCASSDGKPCASVKIEDTANWWLLPPESMQKIQDYTDLLYCIIEGGCQSHARVMGMSKEDAKYQYNVLKRSMRHLKQRVPLLPQGDL